MVGVSGNALNGMNEKTRTDEKKRCTRRDLIRGMLPWPFHKDLPDHCKKLTLGDLVLSVLPWPFHKDLPSYSDNDD